MSRNSKNARNLARAREFTKLRKGGGSGPSSTAPQHGKSNAWWKVGNGAYESFVKGKPRKPRDDQAQEV